MLIKIDRILFNSGSSLLFKQIMKALCTRVEIRLVFLLVELKEFQRRYWPVKVGFLYTEVTKSEFCLSTKTSKKGREELDSFSRIKRREGWRELR